MEYDLLKNLLKRGKADDKSADEDFLTESIAYILRYSEVFFNELINNKIGIKTIKYSDSEIITQKILAPNSIPDITINSRNKDIVCLFEHKIDSPLSKNQLQKYLYHIQNHEEYYIILIQRYNKSIIQEKDYEQNEHIISLSWERDIYILIKRIIDNNNNSELERFLLKSMESLLKSLNLGYIPDSEIIDPQRRTDIYHILNDLVSSKTKLLLKDLPDYEIDSKKDTTGRAGPTRPILWHKFMIKPKKEKFLFSLNLLTLFQETLTLKTQPNDKAVICLEYFFYQTRIETDGKKHYLGLIESHNLNIPPDFWERQARNIYNNTAKKIKYIFENIFQEKKHVFSLINTSAVTSYYNSTNFVISYFDKSEPAGVIRERYSKLIEKIIPIAIEYGIFNIREQFYTNFFEALSY